MSGMLSKSQVPTISQQQLPPAAKVALIEAKNALRCGPSLEKFKNKPDHEAGTGCPLPKPALGCRYLEFDVGQAHPGDDEPRGSQRLVLEVEESSHAIREVYFTTEHYAKSSFLRVL